jgi:hypothetical protein
MEIDPVFSTQNGLLRLRPKPGGLLNVEHSQSVVIDDSGEEDNVFFDFTLDKDDAVELADALLKWAGADE